MITIYFWKSQMSFFYLDDGYDHLFLNVEQNNMPPRLITTVSNSKSIHNNVQNRIEGVYSRSAFARIYLENHFYGFNMSSGYMVNLFISTNIQNYSYTARNRICLFFQGTGATYEIMVDIRSFFALPPRLTEE